MRCLNILQWAVGSTTYFKILAGLFLLITVLNSCNGIEIEQAATSGTDKKISFVKDIAPILALRCQGCHNNEKPMMGFSVSSYSKILKGSKQSGPQEILVAGKPEESRLYEVLLANSVPRMPLKLKSLTAQDLKTIETWIRQGAKSDALSPETDLVKLVPPEFVLAAIEAGKSHQPTDKPSTKPILALSNDGKYVAIGENGWISIYDSTIKGVPVSKVGPLSDQVEFLWIDPSNQFLIVGSGRPGLEGAVSRYQIKENKLVYRTVVHKDQILSMTVSPDSRKIATGSYDKNIAILDLISGRLETYLKEHTEAVYSVAFGPTGSNRLVSASGDRTVKTWDFVLGKRLETMSDSTAELYSVAISNDGRIVYSGGVDRTIRAWDIQVQPPKLIQSALAHDSAITKLIFWTDPNKQRSELISTSEDRTVRRWNPLELKQVGESIKMTDWVHSWSTGSSKVAFGIYNGLSEVYDWSSAGPKLAWLRSSNSAIGGSPESLKPQPFRQTSLGVPSPRIITSGEESEVTLSGLGIGESTKIWVAPKDIVVSRLPTDSSQPNQLKLRLKVPPRVQFEVASIKLTTPLGVTAEQTIGLTPKKIRIIDVMDKIQLKEMPEIASGEIIQTTISKPGQAFRVKLKSNPGQLISISSFAKRIGSTLTPRIRLKSVEGQILADSSSKEGRDLSVSVLGAQNSMIVVELTDTQFSGSGGHFIVLKADQQPIADSQWPPAISSMGSIDLNWKSKTNEQSKTKLEIHCSLNNNRPSIVGLQPPAGWLSDHSRSIVNVIGNTVLRFGMIPTDGAGIGRFEKRGQNDTFMFKARKGERLIIETYAKRLGRNVDTAIEINDSNGMPVTGYRFRKVADTQIAFRDHNSTIKGIRLTHWADFQMGDYVLINREVARILTLPRNPDDDCLFYSDDNRLGYFGTTPEQHPMARTVTKLERISEEMESSIDQNLLHKIPYANDDGGIAVANDSFIDFLSPADGSFSIKVRETQGQFGDDAAYALVVRNPAPDFSLQISPMDWSISTGSPKLLTARIQRFDGFNGPVSLQVEGLPHGWKATPGLVEAGQLNADILIEIPFEKVVSLNPESSWKIVGTGISNGNEIRKEVSGMNSSWVLMPKSNLKITTSASQVQIVPGTISQLNLIAERSEGFSGRIPIDVRNLPYGVRVLDIGLNGVLITEKQTQRNIRIYAEPWVQAQSRPFFAVGRAEGPGTADSSPPVVLNVVRPSKLNPEIPAVSLTK